MGGGGDAVGQRVMVGGCGVSGTRGGGDDAVGQRGMVGIRVGGVGSHQGGGGGDWFIQYCT